MENKKYTKSDYHKLIKTLYDNKDEKYRKFHQNLLNDTTYKLIGVRVPILRNIAKNIAKNDYMSFIKYNTHQTYEETLLHALVIGYIKVDIDTLFKLIDNFMSYNTNWAINDTFANTLKVFKKISIENVEKYINSSNPWSIRFGLTLLLNHYINEKNIDKILKISDSINSDKYYVKMANAWLIQACFVKCRKKTLDYLKNNNLDEFTFNKTISKICDSYRIDKKDKEFLKKLRR